MRPGLMCHSAARPRTRRMARRVSAIDIKDDANQPLVLAKQVDLSFAPRERTLLPKENKLAVADAFAGWASRNVPWRKSSMSAKGRSCSR